MIIVVAFGIVFYPFMNVIGAAIVTAYFAHPLFHRLSRKFKQGIALLLTWLVIFASIVAPIAIIGTISYYQVKHIVKQTTQYLENTQTWAISIPWSESNPIAGYIQEYINESQDEFSETSITVGEWTQKIGEKALGYLGSFAKEIPLTIIKIILYTFLTTSLLLRGGRVKEIVRELIPIDNKSVDLYIEKMKYMTSGIMRGNFIIAAIQAVATTLSFVAIGVPYAGIILVISFILYLPMIGTIVLYVPAMIYLIIKGKFLIAILFFIWNSIIVANIDNVMRGKFVPKEAQIDNSLMFLSVLSGVMIFGVMGVLYGPLLTVIGMTSVKMYMEMKGKEK